MTRRPARRTSSSPQDPHVCRSPSYDIQAKIGFARCWLLRRVPAPRIRFTSPSPPARPGSHASRGGAFSRQLWWAAYPSPPYRYCRVASGRGRPHLPPATISETGTVDAPCKLRRHRARTAPASSYLGSACGDRRRHRGVCLLIGRCRLPCNSVIMFWEVCWYLHRHHTAKGELASCWM
jgi:hypothetical protein